MARKPRIVFPDAIYHAMARGVRKTTFFVDDVDRRKFLKILATALERYGCVCYIYCLMGNHFHLVIQTPRGNISRFMQYLDGVYAKYFNWRHQHSGHVYEGRFNAPVIEDSRYLAAAIAYVARNPVEARLVNNAAGWTWSGYRAIVGKCACPSFLTIDWLGRLFKAPSLQASRRAFAMAVHTEPPSDHLDSRDVRGSEEYRRQVRKVIGATYYGMELPRSYRALGRPTLNELFSGTKRSNRRAVILRAHVVHGYLLAEIARYLEVHPTTVSRIVNRSGSYSRGRARIRR